MRISSVLGVISCLVTLSFSAERAENSSSGSDFYRFTNKIRNPPQITQSPRNQRVAEDSIISFFCKASGNPQPRFQWERDGKRINPKRTRYFIYDMPHGSVLRIEPVKARRDQATFTCIADNGIGEPARANSTLKVYAMNRDKGINPAWKKIYKGIPNGYPSITVNPELKAVEKDRQVKMQCEAIARNAEDMGRPHIFWIKDYIPVDMSDPRITIQPTGTLFIERSQESDAGKYECVAENQIGVTYSFAANLYVRVRRVPPHFTISPENKEVDLHTSINMTCVAIGSPMPVVKWRDGPFELNAEDEVSIGKNVLQLLNVTETKNYTCVASSDLGNIEAVAEVRVKAPGTPPRNVHGRPISTTTIIVEWLPPEKPNGIIKGYKIFYTLDPDLPIILWKRHDVNSNDRAATIENLMPNVTYHMCILAYSSKGEGPVSNLIQVMTRQGARTNCSRKTCFSEFVVPLQPKNLHAVAMSPNVIEVTWDPPENHQSVISYKLYFNDSYRRQSAHITIDPPVSRFRLTDLTPNTIYHIQVSAMSEKGEGAHTPTVQVQTRQFEPHVLPPPENIKLIRSSPDTILVTWDEPKLPVAGYRVYYNMFELQKMELWQKKDIGPYTVTELTELDTVSVYAVRIQARSVDGRYGNLSEAVVCPVGTSQPITIEVPTNFHVSMRTSVDVTLVWEIPKKPQVTRYTLSYSGVKKYREDNIMQTYHQPRKEEHIHGLTSSFTVENLLPKTKYTFNISAFFQDGVQGGVNSLVVQTRIEAPKEVRRPMVLKISGQEVTVILKPASEENGGLSYYYLVVVPLINTTTKRPEDISNDELTLDISPELPSAKPYIAAKFDAQHLPREFNLGNRDQFGGYANRPLDHGMKYKTFIRAFTVDTKLYKTSPYSETISLSRTPSIPQYPPNTNNPIPQSAEASEKSLLIIMIVAPVCAGVALIIIGCIILIWHMSRRKATRKEKSPEPSSGKVFVDVPPHPCDPVELRRQHYQTPGMISHPPIHIHMLQEHIDNLKNNDNLKFSQEYESIEPGQQFTWDNSNYEVNKPKNRYANVIAYDHSRVILQPIDSVPGSDYVNANYMDGYRKQNAYIATQGPLPETFGDFWRMMWEQRSATIVMMTKLEERSRIKCDQYWPHRGAEHYGLMHVLLVDVTELSTYTIRTFHISRYGFPEKREIRQFQFTAWPDHGVPDHPTPLLMFMRRVKTSNPPDAGPMVVHCSAGVGRTGAFIVIDAMLERIRHEKTVDIYGHVTCLRAQRNYMVQTEDQYIFIHDALLEAVTCGNTEVPARNLSVHIQKLMQPEPGETVTGMELEFKRLANMKASPNRFVSANLPVNKFKNRLVNILPFESTRVALQPIRGVDGSDYINASFIDGYKYCQAYVATQGPLSETTEDFWRMLWEHNSTIIVMLTKLREMGREKCHQYWPSERSARYQYFVVDPMAEYNMPQYILREFKVTDARDGQSRTIRQFQFTDWPEQGVPKSGEGFIDFIGQVHKTKEQFGQEGPISVHCSAGVGRTGVFITLSIVLERMRYEGVVDMFQTVKMLRTQRPAMVQTEDQYQFCYRAALEYLGSFDHYAA
ncbi:receptor-type tyrosine-protein phosphatase S-like isoform X12 [Pecten maximus]|uniref:receptor-type tyrosine-protein phosphatase S-like isoform X12 n=1 Tax=Pecten maximus TaxID=6579 RepID=UPI00145899E7|nr:receptor-type tyrosine-protein phosphatase S-like isoform X12 [Pecten maximus]